MELSGVPPLDLTGGHSSAGDIRTGGIRFDDGMTAMEVAVVAGTVALVIAVVVKVMA